MKSQAKNMKIQPGSRMSLSKGKNHGRIVSIPDLDQFLDTTQLNRIEQSFREWVDSTPRADMRFSRQRILIIFLLIRYTGAKLNEVLVLNPFENIDLVRHAVIFRGSETGTSLNKREVHISETLSREIKNMLADPSFREALGNVLDVDPGFVRRKFYERVQACGFSKRLGGPEMIRKARAIELMQSNMPLPAVQMILGHSTPNLTSSYVSFSKDEIQQVAKLFMEKESMRKTSARNSFFGKIQNIQRGDIQTRVDLVTIDSLPITTVITNDSVERLGLKQGRLITAEVKAPWVILQGGDTEPVCSAENRFQGIIARITSGKVNTECVVRISDGIELCAVVSTAGNQHLKLNEGDSIWVLFNCFSVVLHVD
jgi:molybdate transport system regulatory protein